MYIALVNGKEFNSYQSLIDYYNKIGYEYWGLYALGLEMWTSWRAPSGKFYRAYFK